MMKYVKKILVASLSLPLLFLAGCKSIPSYSSDYAKARNNTQGVALDQAKAHDLCIRSISAFNSLPRPAFVAEADSLCADQLCINDTLSQFSSRLNLFAHC